MTSSIFLHTTYKKKNQYIVKRALHHTSLLIKQGMPRTFLTPNGFTVLVGKNRHDNEHVTFELSKPHDFWFHAGGFAGSHVVLQWDPSLSAPKLEDFEWAAHYAAYFSKARESSNVPIHLCRVCDVEKTKRGRPGQVVCTSYYVVHGRPPVIANMPQ